MCITSHTSPRPPPLVEGECSLPSMRGGVGWGEPGEKRKRGFSLIELIAGLVVISLAMVGVMAAYQRVATGSVDPIVRVRLLELAQSQLDQALAQPYDAATPAGGVPACGSIVPADQPPAPACTGGGGVSDWDGVTANPYPGYSTQVSVTPGAGGDLGIDPAAARLVTVVATAPSGESLTLSAYRTNF